MRPAGARLGASPRLLAVSALVAMVLPIVTASPALAAQLSDPSFPSGDPQPARCIVYVAVTTQFAPSPGERQIRVSCNYGLLDGFAGQAPQSVGILYKVNGAQQGGGATGSPGYRQTYWTGSQRFQAVFSGGVGSGAVTDIRVQIVYPSANVLYVEHNEMDAIAAGPNVSGPAVQPDDFPPYPVDYYGPSGVAGTGLLDAIPAPNPACSRVLSTGPTSERVATFRAGVTSTTGTTDTFSWDFGDGVTSTVENPQHVYTTSQPDGGWTTTLTVTRTGDGTTYEVGPVVATCALRVDFLNPDQSEPGGDSVSEPEDSDCPTGFGWLNPLAIVRILKCLFIPQDAAETAGAMWDGITTKAPFSILYEAVTFVPDALGDIEDGIATSGDGFCNSFVHIEKPDALGGPTADPGDVQRCRESFDAVGQLSWLQTTRNILIVLFGIIFLMACYRAVGEILK